MVMHAELANLRVTALGNRGLTEGKTIGVAGRSKFVAFRDRVRGSALLPVGESETRPCLRPGWLASALWSLFGSFA